MGHDIYCTNWEGLRQDARYEHPHIGKLMDSRIMYCADEKYREELEKLIEKVTKKMKRAATELDFETAAMLRDELVELKKVHTNLTQGL